MEVVPLMSIRLLVKHLACEVVVLGRVDHNDNLIRIYTIGFSEEEPDACYHSIRIYFNVMEHHSAIVVA